MAISDLKQFIEKLTYLGLEYFRRYYGPYRARVVDNKDPAGQGRVRVECPRANFGRQNSEWLLPMMDGTGKGKGLFWPPEEGDTVWIFFDNGDPTRPSCYAGGWFGPEELDEAFEPGEDKTPKRRGFQTPGGHRVVLDDSEGEERILIRHKDGTILEWTDSDKVRIGKEGGRFEPMMRGDTVRKWLESHTHPHSWGPTGPPIQPFPPDGLSDDSETS